MSVASPVADSHVVVTGDITFELKGGIVISVILKRSDSFT